MDSQRTVHRVTVYSSTGGPEGLDPIGETTLGGSSSVGVDKRYPISGVPKWECVLGTR